MQRSFSTATRSQRPRRIALVHWFAVTIVLGLSLVNPAPATGAPPRQFQLPPQSPLGASAAALQKACLPAEQTSVSSHVQTGKIRFVGTQPDAAISPVPGPLVLAPTATAEDVARAYLSRCGPLFGLRDQASELTTVSQRAVNDGRTVIRFQQMHRGVPVVAGDMLVHVNRDQNITVIAGEVLPDLDVDVSAPAIDQAMAQRIAVAAAAKEHQLAEDQLQASPAELWVYAPALLRPSMVKPALVWRVEVTSTITALNQFVLVDAQRGAVSLSFDQTRSYDARKAQAPANGVIGVTSPQAPEARNRRTYTANNGTSLPGTLVCTESHPTCSGGSLDAQGAHIGGGEVYDFYQARFGRDSLDNAGITLTSTVHYGVNYANAFYDSMRKQMVYGDGCTFARADDVVAHELTHGVTDFEANFLYFYQSGAISEMFSDVLGEFVDLTNGRGNDSPGVRWLQGEELTGVPGCGPVRNMQDPLQFLDPDRMTSPHYYIGEDDNGGVHRNSGVGNKAAYLMTDGGTFNGHTVAGLGIDKVAQIYYEALTNLLTSGADYAALYDAMYQACLNKIGVAGITLSDCQQVRTATDAVEMNAQPVAGYNTDAPVCAPDATPVNLFFDDHEVEGSNWIPGGLVGGNRWTYRAPYVWAYSGTGFRYADDYPGEVSDSYFQMATSVPLPANARLWFAHAYGFENPNFDGGVLEYSVNNGTTWNDAGSLFDFNGYPGTINSGSGNPLGGRQGFVGTSHGYISSRLNLSTLAGQSVRFRWRMGTDVSLLYLGWWLDDVRIYTCQGSANAADLSIGMSVAPNPGTIFFPLTYTIAITNNGPATATGVQMTHTLHSGYTLVSATPSSGSCSGVSTVNCAIGTLVNGASTTVIIVAVPHHFGGFFNDATVTANEADPTVPNRAFLFSTINGPSTPYTISGTVRNLAGNPVASALVSAIPDSPGQLPLTTLSDVNGAFTFRVVAGVYRIQADKASIGSGQISNVVVPPDRTGINITLGAPPPPPPPTVAYTISLPIVIRACPTGANQAPAFPNPTGITTTTSLSYDNAGRLIGATTDVTIQPANDPDGDDLTYAWTSTNGSIVGMGTRATWQRVIQFGNVAKGDVTITVSDCRGGTDTHTIRYR